MTAPRDRYQALLDRAFPLTDAMGLELTRLDAGHAATRMPLARNRNVHGTAFAGSLSAQAMLTGWVLLTWHLEQAGLGDALLVQREATIRYLEPVTVDPVCHCAIDAAELERFRVELTRTGKARITAEVEIGDGATPAAVLISGFSARLKD